MSSSMFGRPANSGSTPTLGTPQQRSQATAIKQAQVSHRQRQIYSMLAGGVSNRLLLSLRSGLPKEIDYALELFLQYSYTDAASIPLDVLPGLPSALLDVVRPPSSPLAPRDSETLRRRTEAALILRNFILEGGQRSIESVRPYVDYMYEVLVQVLEEEAQDDIDPTSMPRRSTESTTELLLYMLDMAEVYASTCTLLLPPPPEQHIPLNKQIPAQKLYTLLARLAQSNDRALIIGTYTLLGGLAMNRNNNPIFSYRMIIPGSTNKISPECPSTMLLKRAISLLSLNDAEILLPILEFLYQHTLIPSNASRLLQSQNMRQVIRSTISHLKEGAKEETVEYELTQTASSSSSSPSNNNNKDSSANGQRYNYRGKAMREALIAAYPSLDTKEREKARTPMQESIEHEPLMTAEAVQSILYMQEPQRAYAWMKTVFEADPNGEITQVSLWRAYQKQFESYDALMKSGSIPTMLTASDVIKGTQEAFDTASPKQVEEDGQRRFIISGIKIKPPQPIMMTPAERERDLWRCKWNGCQFARPEAEPFENASQLYEHLENAHLEENPATLSSSSSSSTRQICRFEQCNLSFDTRRQLHFHLRTHIPTRTPLSPSAPPTLAHAADAFDRMKTFFTEQRQIPQTVQGEYAAGIGFVASLVVRNCARATVAAAQRYRRSTGLVAVSGSANSNNEGMHLDGGNNSTRGSKNAALDNEEDDIHRRKMFGFLTGSTTDDTTSEDKDQFESGNNGSEALPHLTADQVKNAVSALCSVEQEIIAVNAANKALTSYLMETLVCIEDAKKAVDGVL